jgi:two-component system, OmpR family, sensor histidine kinase CreC
VSTRRRLALVLAALVALGFAGLIPWQMRDLRPRYLATIEETMVDSATLLASVINADSKGRQLDAARLDTLLTTQNELAHPADIYDLHKVTLDTWVVVTDDQGKVIFHQRDPARLGEDWSRWNDVSRTLAGRYGARTTTSDLGKGPEEVLHIAAPLGPAEHPHGVLILCKPARAVALVMTQARRAIVATTAAAALCVLLLGWAATWWLTRPIAELTTYVRATEAGARQPAPALAGTDVQKLGNAFEAMRDALDGKAYIEHYLQTLTHEMKAPVAGIRAAAELLDESLPENERARFLANLRGESARLQDLLDRVLALAALERRRSLDGSESISVHDLLVNVADSLSTRSQARGIHVALPTTTAIVHGERFLLRQAVSNLLANAIDFAPRDSAVTFSVEQRGERLLIGVRDLGPGIPAYAQERIFERFYSLPRPDTGNKGTGLGLPFVREIALLHGGSVTVASHPEGGTRAVLDLPAG